MTFYFLMIAAVAHKHSGLVGNQNPVSVLQAGAAQKKHAGLAKSQNPVNVIPLGFTTAMRKHIPSAGGPQPDLEAAKTARDGLKGLGNFLHEHDATHDGGSSAWTSVQLTQTQLVGMAAVDLLVLYVFWAICCQGSKHSVKRVKRDDFTGNFAPVGVCACVTGRTMTVFETFFCHPFLWAQTMSNAELLNYWLALFIYAVLIIMWPLTWSGTLVVMACIRIWYRTKLRAKYEQGSDLAYDTLYQCCCTMCSIQQEYQFVEAHADMEAGNFDVESDDKSSVTGE